jgi:hypothetical protein
MNILESIKLIQALDNKANDAKLKKWEHFAVINHTKSWQSPEYYKDAPALEKCSKLSFGNFLQEIFRYSGQRYSRMEQICKLKNGRKLFLKYGFANMSTYCNSTETEREAIVKKHKTCVASRSFISIKRELFPPTAKEQKAVDYKAKYAEAKKEIERLKSKIEVMKSKYDDDVKKLREAIAVLSMPGMPSQDGRSLAESPKSLN